MNPLVRVAARVYPRAWRKRYGAEFAALLEDSGAGWQVLADVVLGGMEMRAMTTDFRLLAGLGLAGLAVGGIVAFQVPNRYRSNAVAQVTLSEGASQSDLADAIVQAENNILSRTSLSRLMQDPELNLYSSERQTKPLDDVIELMKSRDIRIEIEGKGHASRLAFRVSYQGPSPAIAKKTTDRLLSMLLLNNLALSKRAGSLKMKVLDPPSLPQLPASPNRYIISVAGFGAGLALGVLLAGIRRWPTVALMGAGGAILAGVISFGIPNRYVSTAVVRPHGAAVATDVRSKVFGNHEVIMDVLRAAGPGTTRGDLRIQRRAGDLQIQVVSRNREGAQRAAQKVIVAMVDASQAGVGAAEPTGSIEVLDPPHLPQSPLFPNRVVIAALGFMAGLFLAIVLRALRRYRPRLQYA